MPISLSTWKHGFQPNQITYDAILNGKSALVAVELGARFCEADLTCMSVGRGGLPDAMGEVTLDASIMDDEGNCGAVAFVRNYEHVASIARRVMERTPHVMLVGEGAERFAASEGFERTDLLTEKAKALWEQWMKQPDKLHVRLRRAEEGEHEYVFVKVDEEGKENVPPPKEGGGASPTMRGWSNESHDTIGILAMDKSGHLAGACTTSGLAFKMQGRVGDSPIIGAGLYVAGGVAAAVATGNGELMMRACSAFHIVELIRQGVEPQEACEQAIARILQDKHLTDDMQAGLMVIRADGVWAARSLRPGFQLAAASDGMKGNNILYDVTSNSISAIKQYL
jgi:N4-(beta-N-acetylglucosaminyl)-L-asparaginase